jgi:ZIP family zinc transporter
VLEALWWGAFGSSSLLIGAVFALRVTVNRLVLGLVMGFGAGILLSAVAFELVEEAFDTSGVLSDVATGLFAR